MQLGMKLAIGLAFGLTLTTTAGAAGDVHRGKVLSAGCVGCHSIPGQRNAYPSYRVPMLGGQHEVYLVDSLKAYRSKERPHETMQAQAASLSDQDMADLAAYFASLGELLAGPGDDSAAARRGRDKAITCVACHGDIGVGLAPEWPTLAGQHESYLHESLMQYKNGTRTNAVMAGLVISFSEQDLRDISAFYAAQQGLFTAKRPD